MFSGCFTALITPLTETGIDEEAFTRLIEWQIGEGVHGLVPSGTTGESPTLTHEEHNHVIELCVRAAAGRVPVMAGTGSNATAEAIMMTQHAEKVGADAVLIACPYYNKPTQEGIYQHYKAIHDASTIPIVLYNIPGRSVVDINDSTMARLAELPRIIGNKDATGDLSRPLNICQLLKDVRDDFVLLSGEDATAVEFNEKGGQGCISVTANIAPKQCAALQDAFLAGNVDEAYAIQKALMPLHDAMFCETSPGPVKYAAARMGLCEERLRLPLVPPSKAHQAQIDNALLEMGLIEG